MIESNTESVIGDPLVAEETDDIDDTEAGPQREFNFEGILWDASWIDQWDLDDDLED